MEGGTVAVHRHGLAIVFVLLRSVGWCDGLETMSSAVVARGLVCGRRRAALAEDDAE